MEPVLTDINRPGLRSNPLGQRSNALTNSPSPFAVHGWLEAYPLRPNITVGATLIAGNGSLVGLHGVSWAAEPAAMVWANRVSVGPAPPCLLRAHARAYSETRSGHSGLFGWVRGSRRTIAAPWYRRREGAVTPRQVEPGGDARKAFLPLLHGLLAAGPEARPPGTHGQMG